MPMLLAVALSSCGGSPGIGTISGHLVAVFSFGVVHGPYPVRGTVQLSGPETAAATVRRGGAFRFDIPAGTYTVSALIPGAAIHAGRTAGPLRTTIPCQSRTAVVQAEAATNVVVVCQE